MQAVGSGEKVPEAVLAAMRRTNELFDTLVVGKRDIDVLDRIYTEHAHLLPPGAPVIQGRPQIKAFWKQAIVSMGVKSAKLSTIYAEPAGDDIIEIGRADLGLADGKAVNVKYVVDWKQEGGDWKWNIDIWNANE